MLHESNAAFQSHFCCYASIRTSMDSNISIATCPARTTNRALITGSSSQFNQRIGRTIHEGDEPSSFALAHLPTSIDAEDSSARTLQAIERNLPDSGFIKGGDIPSAADIVVFDLGMIRMDAWMSTNWRNTRARTNNWVVCCRRH